ncbi:MerR family transcriptional regulator [Nocardia transvalensis]|uniref:MerR family transcriptional regulator n=1 Tax=Nocardia transvalensis TaxID=37333 RepID=UPI001894E318|nr:MerR family transcriptional regulator [Nocardia transvalensis]MBF6327856.1 MerR family transcriptional regulator [Nocardia transvalensis]
MTDRHTGAERRWRVVELARLAGVSEQQIRNYADTGVLPEAPRAANGYREFTDHHADALRTARAFAAGHGWGCTRLVLGAVHDGDIPKALAAIDESHAELARERALIATAVAAFAAAANDPGPAPRRTARIGRVAATVGVHAPVLRLWEQRGLLRPGRDPATGYRVFDPAEQRVAHLIAVLRRGGFPFPVITAAIEHLRTTGSIDSARAELARRDQQVHARSLQRLRGTAAVHTYLDTYYTTGRPVA